MRMNRTWPASNDPQESSVTEPDIDRASKHYAEDHEALDDEP